MDIKVLEMLCGRLLCLNLTLRVVYLSKANLKTTVLFRSLWLLLHYDMTVPEQVCHVPWLIFLIQSMYHTRTGLILNSSNSYFFGKIKMDEREVACVCPLFLQIWKERKKVVGASSIEAKIINLLYQDVHCYPNFPATTKWA